MKPRASIAPQLQKRIGRALLWGCAVSAGFMAAGLLLYYLSAPGATRVTLLGLAALLCTPLLRTLLLARGYQRSGERGFAALALAVSLLITLSVLLAF